MATTVLSLMVATCLAHQSHIKRIRRSGNGKTRLGQEVKYHRGPHHVIHFPATTLLIGISMPAEMLNEAAVRYKAVLLHMSAAACLRGCVHSVIAQLIVKASVLMVSYVAFP